MTVEENISFGLKMRKMNKQAISQRVDQMLDVVGLRDWRKLFPAQLSGGQQQRVALVRALAPDPQVLLLDEPLSALDAKIRVRLRAEVKRLQQELKKTMIYVTHDQEEALSIADRVVVMEKGQFRQVGRPIDIYKCPSSDFVADFVGTSNFFKGLRTDDRVKTEQWEFTVAQAGSSYQEKVVLAIRRHERSPQSYADDRYYFAWSGQLYMILIGHGETEDWELNNRLLQSFQFDENTSYALALTAIPTALSIDPANYQVWWTYTHPVYGFSIILPDGWVVNEVTSNDSLMIGHRLKLGGQVTTGGTEYIRMTFRRIGENTMLWPTGVGPGEFIQQGTLDIAGQPSRRLLLVCHTGEVTSIWYHDAEEGQVNIVRGEMEPFPISSVVAARVLSRLGPVWP